MFLKLADITGRIQHDQSGTFKAEKDVLNFLKRPTDLLELQ